MLSANKRTRLPFTGRSKTKNDSSRINITLMNESKKYGVTFKDYSSGFNGETRSTSMVPNSFSR
jgi:hypothetical protein